MFFFAQQQDSWAWPWAEEQELLGEQAAWEGQKHHSQPIGEQL